MISNIEIGNKTEQTISSIFRQHGYWVYNCPRSNAGGQPVDFIAIKKNKAKDIYLCYLVDGKHVSTTKVSFTFDRIEPNQIASMMYMNGFSGIDADRLGFVIEFDRTNTFYWLSFKTYLDLTEQGRKSVNLAELELFEKELNKNE